VKIKLTKGELKRQRDALKQYQRYLPTLQLKKQQLQMEIVNQKRALDDKKQKWHQQKTLIEVWAGLLSDKSVDLKNWVRPAKTITSPKNIAGVDLAVFERVEFNPAEYDLFLMPLWVDRAIEELQKLASLREEISILEKGMSILRHELRITTQRVNLFEKVKIPEAMDAIRLIKIYLGDQMTNAVGRSKIAKKKIEAAELEEVAV